MGLLFSDYNCVGGACLLQHLAVMVQTPHLSPAHFAILDEATNSAAASVSHACRSSVSASDGTCSDAGPG